MYNPAESWSLDSLHPPPSGTPRGYQTPADSLRLSISAALRFQNADAFSMLQTTHESVAQLSRIFPASESSVRLKSLEPVMRFVTTLQA
jgi:hypothetical protein